MRHVAGGLFSAALMAAGLITASAAKAADGADQANRYQVTKLTSVSQGRCADHRSDFAELLGCGVYPGRQPVLDRR